MNLISVIFTIFVQFCVCEIHRGGILYPKNTETRQVVPLDGLWYFIAPNTTNPFIGFENHWYKRSLKEVDYFELHLMPVPASYNDITTDKKIRDHVGLVWYDRSFFVPTSWQSERVWLRFGSISYAAQVWVNGQLVMSHEIGHLPFVAEITDVVKFGKENLVTVACDNTLLSDTVPQGKVEELISGRLDQTYTFDFFNYAGIDRPVYLYTTPKIYIDDITIATVAITETEALLEYNISILGNSSQSCRVTVLDKNKKQVASSQDLNANGVIKVDNPILWWPYLMDSNPGYQYTFQIEIFDENSKLIDHYPITIGIRTLTWTNTSLLINNKPLYLHGFGRHEDSDIRGKGLDLPLVIRDHNLIKWVGANVYRTSHYPYAEEIMDVADELGIMIIDECPSVNTEIFTDTLLAKHKISLTELIKRDKNRPSVIIWSAANEPRTAQPAAKNYFKQIIEHIKTLDNSRPTTIVESQSAGVVESSRYVDIISFNRYNGWYHYEGDLDVITYYVIKEAQAWHDRFQKPVIMQEYGADTLEGLHFLPTFIWSEEYQVKLMSEHFKAFDYLRKQSFFIGEFLWNFADFKTAQTYTRVGGNKKGIFTRNRQPKLSAYHLRRRYWQLASEYNSNVTLPEDLQQPYVFQSSTSHIEL
ncbi:beta-glucuronidase-like [Diorhabda carinulata]|uniref:beta-glucuronidase-like n=1 Tax=Diorhabda carinulata TaxID=1163345 RepID=UPI0025A052F4|nr:beta-glucuronidase-like [Diorhabda carinulata]XP_057653721.1 beta-glucuronidase-like [Diorhabda carinulata]